MSGENVALEKTFSKREKRIVPVASREKSSRGGASTASVSYLAVGLTER